MGIIQITLKATVATALLAGSVGPVYARSTEVAPVAPSKVHQTTWDLNSSTFIRLVPREKGAKPNEHPVKLDAAVLAAKLGAILTTTQEKQESLFEKAELGMLTRTLSEALALADPGEDLLIFSGNKRGHGTFSATTAVVARLFVKDGALNFLVHDTRLEIYVFRMNRSDMWRLPTASRTAPTQEAIQCPGAVSVRPDWLVLPLDLAARAEVAVPVPAPKPQEVLPSPVNSEQRLRLLKQLREENIISEEEYQTKRREILKTL